MLELSMIHKLNMAAKIAINEQRKISSIQEEFNTVFPYLRMEFFSKPIKPGVPAVKKLIKQTNKTLGDFSSVHDKGDITVTPSMTVAGLEDSFKEMFGLGVKIFRKSGKAWLETTITDIWTLEEQNHQGEDLSR